MYLSLTELPLGVGKVRVLLLDSGDLSLKVINLLRILTNIGPKYILWTSLCWQSGGFSMSLSQRGNTGGSSILCQEVEKVAYCLKVGGVLFQKLANIWYHLSHLYLLV